VHIHAKDQGVQKRIPDGHGCRVEELNIVSHTVKIATTQKMYSLEIRFAKIFGNKKSPDIPRGLLKEAV